MRECAVFPLIRSESPSGKFGISIETEETFLASWEADVIRAARRGVVLRGTSWPTVDDVAQDVRVRLCRAFRAVKPSEGYARRVIQNAVLNSTRRQERSVSTTNQDGTRVYEPIV